MRILQVINSLDTGGAEKLLLDSLPKYIERGVDMELLLLNGIKYPFLAELQKLDGNIDIHILSKGTVYNPLHIFKIIPFLKKYDLIHVHLFPALYWVALAKVFSFSTTKLVFTEHNISNRRRGFFFSFMDKFVYARFRKIVTITSEVEQLLQEHIGEGKDKFVLIHNGVDISKIRIATPANRADFSISDVEKIIIQVSSFTEQKDQLTLIKAIPLLELPVQLILVGSGPLMDDCKQLAKEWGVADKVQFLGIRTDVPRLLKMADIVVLSSHYEGLSLSSMEGLASGRPFVASRVPGLTQVVDKAGILFPENDEKALAEHLNSLLRDPEYYNTTAAKGLERAAQYSIDKMIDKHISLYLELCKNQS